MQLSFDTFDDRKNLLPFDGELIYIENFMDVNSAQQFFENLYAGIDWEHEEFYMYGKKIISKRKVAWYGENDLEYGYSGIHRKAKPWTSDLHDLKGLIEKETSERFNSCLLNLYHNGSEGMGWHSDNEKELKAEATIASLSLGSSRKFSFKHMESKKNLSLILQNGSLLLMKGKIQQFWLHQLPKTKKSHGPRINLTFRSINQKS